MMLITRASCTEAICLFLDDVITPSCHFLKLPLVVSKPNQVFFYVPEPNQVFVFCLNLIKYFFGARPLSLTCKAPEGYILKLRAKLLYLTSWE